MQKLIVALAIGVSIIGIVVLFFLKVDVAPQELVLSGEVKSVFKSDKVTFISMVPSNFTILSFDDLGVEKGKVSFVGRLQEYKGRVEFIADRILPEEQEARD